MSSRSGLHRVAVLALGAVLSVSPPVVAQQEARARVQENFRRDPNGIVLARVAAGTSVRVLSQDGPWSEVEVRGFVWLASLQATDEQGFDLVVSQEGGENLRAAPSGRIVARLEEGALLDQVARDPAWAEVSRRGWMWSASLDTGPGATGGPMIQPEAPPAVTGGAPTGGVPPTPRSTGFTTIGPAGASILTAPGGDTLATAAPGADVQLMGREGSWLRVRVEGWVWMPTADSVATVVATDPVALTPDELRVDARRHVGRVVEWVLQFISLERAEAVRTDFFEGEPFLLTRYGGADGPFVYVAVPQELMAEVDGLVPLERITVSARVRTGASVLTDTPILDLLTLERSREAP